MKKILLLIFVLFFGISVVNAESKYENYRPYMGKLDNEVLETKTVTQNNVSIERKKLKPVSNVKTYGMCYEYIITNSTGKDITIVGVESKDRITLAGAWGRSNIPNKSDFVPGYGLAKGIQTDKEKNRFTKRLPENETIEAGDTMRVLIMAPKSAQHKATFTFTVNGKNVVINMQ